MKTIKEHGIETTFEDIPANLICVDEYHPHSCPWDSYGNTQLRQLKKVLNAVGIEVFQTVIHRSIISPIGSGPGGRIRFGDNMMPGIYKTFVAQNDEAAARLALVRFQEEINNWLHADGAMPVAIMN